MSLWSKIKRFFTVDTIDQHQPAFPDFSRAAARGVFGGLLRLNPARYNGWPGDCPGADLDARRTFKLASSNGVVAVELHDAQCTRDGCYAAAQKAGENIKEGDLLVLYYSGHGGQQRDENGDEADGLDETLCLYDGTLNDDYLFAMLSKIPAGVRVLLITDCCNSRTMARGPIPVAMQIYGLSDLFECELIHLAGCDDGKSSIGGSDGGILTNAMLEAFRPGITYREWIRDTIAAVPRKYQTPFCTGYRVSDKFWNTPVFK
jgi:hypothetical protein